MATMSEAERRILEQIRVLNNQIAHTPDPRMAAELGRKMAELSKRLAVPA